MPTLGEIRENYPQYSDLSDGALADALHSRFYSDMPRDVFNQKVGLPAPPTLGQAVGEIWDKPEGVSLIGMAKHMYEGALAPGRAAAGKFNVTPETPGQWSEEDQFRADHAQRAMREGASGLAGLTMAGSLPRVSLEGSRNALGMGFAGPGQTAGAKPIAPVQTAAHPGQIAEAAARIEVPLPRFIADESRVTQGLAAGLQNIPGAGDKIAKAASNTTQALGRAADEVAEGFGTRSPAMVAGAEAKDALTNWAGAGSQKIADRVYGAVDGLVNPAIRTELRSTAQTVQKIMDERANARIPGKSAAVELVSEGIAAPMNYHGLKALRSHLGEMTPEEIVSSGLKAGEVKRLYSALTVDLQQAAMNAGGAKALSAFQKATRVYDQIIDRKASLTKILGVKGDAAPEAVSARLTAMAGSKSSANISTLMMARKTMGPEAWNELSSGVVSRLGRDAQGEFSVQRFLTAYGNLSTNGRAALFKSTNRDSLGRALDDIHLVSKEIQDKLSQFSNPSGTGRSLVSTGVVLGVLHSPIQTLSTMLGGSRMATYLSEPVTARATADWIKAYRDSMNMPHADASKKVGDAAERLANEIVRRDGGDAKQIVTQLSLGSGGALPSQQ